MSQDPVRPKLSEKGLLTPDNCVLTLIDLQPQMLFGVSNFDRQSIINNNVALSKAAQVFGVPVVLSTVETKTFSGNMWPQIQAIFPGQVPIERTSMNSWDDTNYVAAIEKRQGLKIAVPEEIALRQGFIGPEQLERLIAERYAKNDYGHYLRNVLNGRT